MVQTDIGAKIRQVRKAKKMSLQAFAERIGVSYGYLGQVERNEKSVNATIIFGIKREFGQDLTEGESPPGETTKICEPGQLYSATGEVKWVSIQEEDLLRYWEKMDEGSRRTLVDVARALARARDVS